MQSNYKVEFSKFAFMDLVSRLKTFLDSRQISVTQFADECGIPRPTGSQLLAGRNKKVSDEIIGKIHQAYPELNVVWLMFGEGTMVNNANIEISEPQIAPKQPVNFPEQPAPQQSAPTLDFETDIHANTSEKISQPTSAPQSGDRAASIPGFGYDNTFTFATPSTEAEKPAESTPSGDSSDDSITLTPGKGKRVTGIVVYYDDCTYESFIPDPTHSHPFISR